MTETLIIAGTAAALAAAHFAGSWWFDRLYRRIDADADADARVRAMDAFARHVRREVHR